jgi:nitroreductase
MDTKESIETRRSTRAFLDKSIEREVLEGVLRLALQAPSAINLQPWEVVVVSGEEKSRLSRLLVKRMKERNISCGPGARAPLPEHYMERQRGLLKVMTEGLPVDISFQDYINEGSCNFYGAPTAIIVTMDRAFSEARMTDIGVFTGYLVLAAHSMGLGTCPIGLITAFEDDIIEELSLAEEMKIVIGVAVGYRDPEARINQVRSERVSIEDTVKWRG